MNPNLLITLALLTVAMALFATPALAAAIVSARISRRDDAEMSTRDADALRIQAEILGRLDSTPVVRDPGADFIKGLLDGIRQTNWEVTLIDHEGAEYRHFADRFDAAVYADQKRETGSYRWVCARQIVAQTR